MRWSQTFAGVFAAALLIGCGPPVSPVVDKYKEQILQSELDGQLTSIRDAISMNATAGADGGEPLVVVGKIYGGDLDAFDAGKASFTIIELPEPGHDHEDPGDCVFCKRKLENADMAVVHLVDENDAEIDVPADRLLGLSTGMNVLAKGDVERVGDMLVVRAKQICVLDDAQATQVYESLHGTN